VVQRKESRLGTYRYPAEFRADAVALVRSSGRPIAQVALFRCAALAGRPKTIPMNPCGRLGL
jgi:hypothetical protein